LRDSFFVAGGSEITVECNPASIDLKGLEGLRSLGVNRLSIGLQSANDDELEMLGRVHSFDDFCVTYENARRVGFDNISVDLMYGLPLQTKDKLEYSLEKLIELSPEHISAYGLKIEEGTRFYKDRDSLALPDDDTCAEFYELCCERFAKSGYRRYEISNFSLDGRESRHNLKYWSLEDYDGFGVAAYSCFRGERFGNSRNIKGFLEGRDICEYRQKISNNDKISEYVMLGLRLEKGISLEDYFVISGRELLEDYPTVKDFISKGFMKLEDGRLAFSTKGFLVSNIILSEILAFED
jgi:oxygen-independent coproporphyrinogen-3 oxidase